MFPALLGPIASLAGGVLGFLGQQDANAANAAAAQRNIDLQREFAQQGIRWKVEDAKAAGIHPAAALGASTTSFSPVSIGASNPMGGMSSALASMGQDVSRAINATRTSQERDQAFLKSAGVLELEGKQLDNDIKRATLASSVQRLKQAANPAMPAIGPTPIGPIPMEDKHDKIPPLMLGNDWVHPDAGTSNMQKFSDRYGDEGIPSWLIPPFIMWNDYRNTSSHNLDRLYSNPFHMERADPVGKWWDNYLLNWRRERELGARSGWR